MCDISYVPTYVGTIFNSLGNRFSRYSAATRRVYVYTAVMCWSLRTDVNMQNLNFVHDSAAAVEAAPSLLSSAVVRFL